MQRTQAQRKKQSETCAQKLIPRLARYLGNDSLYGKNVVRKILKDGGYKGPGWKNEERAIRILTEAGKDMSGFERQDNKGKGKRKGWKTASPKTNGITVVEATSPSADAVERLKRATIFLLQGKRMLMEEIKEGKRADIGKVENCLLAALNEARE